MKSIVMVGMLFMSSIGLMNVAHALDEKEKLVMVFDDTPSQEKKGKGGAVIPRIAENAGKGCTLAITDVVDLRKNQETVGGSSFMMDMFPDYAPLTAQSVRSGDGKGWMESVVLALGRYGFEIQRPQSAVYAPGVLPTKIKLKLAHAWNSGLNLNSHVTFEVSFIAANGPVAHLYHGLGTKTNWWNGTGEYMDVLNLGVADILDALIRDAVTECRSPLNQTATATNM